MAVTLKELTKKALDGHHIADIIKYYHLYNATPATDPKNDLNAYCTKDGLGKFLKAKNLLTTNSQSELYSEFLIYTLKDGINRYAKKFNLSDSEVSSFMTKALAPKEEWKLTGDGSTLAFTINELLPSTTSSDYTVVVDDTTLASSAYTIANSTSSATITFTSAPANEKAIVITYDRFAGIANLALSQAVYYVDNDTATVTDSTATKVFVLPGDTSNAAKTYSASTNKLYLKNLIAAYNLGSSSTGITGFTLTGSVVSIEKIQTSGVMNNNDVTPKAIEASVNATDVVLIENCDFGETCHKTIVIDEQGSTLVKTNAPKTITIKNCTFSGVAKDYAIDIIGTQDNANILVENCEFDNVGNVIRMCNQHNATGIKVTFKNCVVNELTAVSPNNGFIVFEDKTTGTSAEAEIAANRFGTDESVPGTTKITVNFEHCTLPSGLLSSGELSALCGSGTASQLLYVFRTNALKLAVYSDTTKAYYPKVNII